MDGMVKRQPEIGFQAAFCCVNRVPKRKEHCCICSLFAVPQTALCIFALLLLRLICIHR